MKTLQVGDVVTNAMPLLGCEPGTRGVVYQVYEDFEEEGKFGASIIFENGAYDGFSHEDQQIMLNEEEVKYVPFWIHNYKFTNVVKLTEDFREGFWDEIFR